MKGSGLPYPPQAVLDEQMHQTKLAVILDPDEMQAFALYDLVDETRGTSEAVDGGILEVAGKMFLWDGFYSRNAAVGFMPVDFLEYGLASYFDAVAAPGHDYYLSTDEVLAIAEL